MWVLWDKDFPFFLFFLLANEVLSFLSTTLCFSVPHFIFDPPLALLPPAHPDCLQKPGTGPF